MPYIKEEDLVKLYSEVDTLTNDKDELQKGYIDLKLKSEKVRKKDFTYKIAILILILLCGGIIMYAFFNQKKLSTAVKEAEKREQIAQDSIQKLSLELEKSSLSINSEELIYLVQIGNFEKIDLFNTSKGVSNFQQIKQNNYNTYLLGGFSKYAEAKNFKKHIRKLGIKDAFIVAYKNSQRLDIREALELSGETEYIKYFFWR